MDDQLDVLFRHRGTGQDSEPLDERVREERKRYTTQLQRRAQAHVTAELGGGNVMPDIDRQVTSVLQHAQDATKAPRRSTGSESRMLSRTTWPAPAEAPAKIARCFPSETRTSRGAACRSSP